MKLSISLIAHRATLELKDGETLVDSAVFAVDNDLAAHILTEIEALLKKNDIDPLSIEDVETSAENCGFTTERIAQTVANAYNFALNSRNETHYS